MNSNWAWLLVGIIALCNTIGDVLNTAGMKRQGEIEEFSPRSVFRLIARVARNPLVVGGIVSLAVAFFCLISLLSISDVSFAVPATSLSYILETILAKQVLKEDVGRRRWIAVALVAVGAALLQW